MDDAVIWIGGLAIVALLALGITAGIHDAREWERFRVAHKCVVVGRMEGDWVTGVGPAFGGKGGVAVTTSRTPDKTGWKCDDGITYWRSN